MLYREIIAVCSQIHTKHINTLCGQNVEFFGAFAKLRKAITVTVMTVSPPVPIEQLGSHWTDFHEIWYLSIFRTSVEKIPFPLISDKKGYFTLRPMYICYHFTLSSS
jgi:hypothetical protein